MQVVRTANNGILAVAAVGILGGGSLVGVGIKRDDGASMPLTGYTNAASTTTVSSAPASSVPSAAASRKSADRALDAALAEYAPAGEYSVAVLDRKTGQKYSYRGSVAYDTASIVKVQVLACLLMTAQDQDRDLTSTELALARRMIRLSDNDATTTLFSRLGQDSAVQACDRRLGLTHTDVNSAWGLTRTTADDQVKLLAQLVSERSPLDEDSRELAHTLMSTVDGSQDWGVPAVARAGEEFTVKNGWDTRTADHDLWVVNSIGRITGPSADVSIAVLSHGHATMAAGISVVETVARMTRRYLRY